MNDELMMETYERIQLIQEEVDKILRALRCLQEGVPFDESFTDEVFTEANYRKKAESLLAQTMSHLLKIKYSERYSLYKEDKKHWMDEILNFNAELISILSWNKKRRETVMINQIIKDMDEIYDDARYLYGRATETNPHLIENQKYIPDTCPWTLEDLMIQSADALVNILTDPK